MDKKTNKVKAFIKEHKKAIFITGATMAAGSILYAVTKNKDVIEKSLKTIEGDWVRI